MAQQAAASVDVASSKSNKQPPPLQRRRIGFIGCGKMAFAIAKGFIQSGACSAADIIVSSPNLAPNRIRFRNVNQQELGCTTTSSNADVAASSEVVIIATKPHAVENVIREDLVETKLNTLIISIAAGVTLERMHNAFSANTTPRPLANAILKIIRVAPNMPMQLGLGWGACCMASGPNIPEEDAAYCEKLFSTVAGVCVNVPEPQLNIAGALIGGGPAYVFILIESLADAAVMEGLSRNLAQKLAAQMVMGSAKMLCESTNGAAAVASVLKDEICSPGGTTIAGLFALEKGGYRAAIMSAIHAATERSRQLGEKK